MLLGVLIGHFVCLFPVFQVSWSTHQSLSLQDSLLHVGKILLRTQELCPFSVMPGLKDVCDQTQLRICAPLVKIQWVVPLRWDQKFLLVCKPVLGACKVLGCRSLRIPGSLPFRLGEVFFCVLMGLYCLLFGLHGTWSIRDPQRGRNSCSRNVLVLKRLYHPLKY